MADRPAVPIEVQREVLFAACHRCAVCCLPLPLELAHIIPWHKTRDHGVANLIALCSNCHTRADKENWGALFLRSYRQQPCALRAQALPPISPEQKALVDLIIACDPEFMTEQQRLRLVSLVAAYVDVSVDKVHVVRITAANSSRVRISLPENAAKRLLEGFQGGDPMLTAFFEEVHLLAVHVVEQGSSMVSDLSGPGLRVNARIVGDVVVLDLAGRITMGRGATVLRDALRELILHGHAKILLNLQEVNYIDSSGIGELVAGFTAVTNAGAQLKILALGKRINDLLSITKYYTAFTIFDDERHAIQSFERA